MVGSAYMRTFLLLVSIAGAHCYNFREPGQTIRLSLGWGAKVDYSVLYRVYEDGDLLLANCSQPDSPPLDGYDITCDRESKVDITLTASSLSQTGLYRVDGWTSGNITRRMNYKLIVYAERMADHSERFTPLSSERAADVSSKELCWPNVTLGNGTTLRVYREVSEGWLSVVLDSSSSLEPLVEDLKGRLQLDLNSSRVILQGMSGERFTCTIWREDQCLSYRTERGRYDRNIFTHEGKSVTLPCISIHKTINKTVYWETTARINYTDPNSPEVRREPVIIRPQEVTRPQEVMYMLNGSQSGNYSLIIPAVSKQHSGRYECKTLPGNDIITYIFLSVCPQSLPLNVMFSHGESVPLAVNDTGRKLVYWYRKKDLQSEEELLYSSVDFVQMPGQLRDRVTVNRHSYTLTISNLTAEDTTVFTWRRFPYYMRDCCWCMEGSIRLVYRDAFGVHSPFYRAYGPLLGCVLLGLVAGVIWLKLRSRRGALTPGGQEMEMQDIGDEDVYDDVEEAEDSV